MKKIDLGQAIQILANLGVIAGIAFLTFEIRQSNTQAYVASLLEDGGKWSEWRYAVGSDAEAASIYYLGLRDFDQLNPIDRMRFDLLIRSRLYRLEVGYETFAELGTNIAGARRAGTVQALFAEDGFREWWDYTDHQTLPRPIVEYLAEVDPRKK